MVAIISSRWCQLNAQVEIDIGISMYVINENSLLFYFVL